jgi:hypothetical protein
MLEGLIDEEQVAAHLVEHHRAWLTPSKGDPSS